jgi:hypothetical protein
MSNRRWLYAILISIMLFAFIPANPVSAQTNTVSFTTSITYQNASNVVAHVSILFYSEGSDTPISIPRPDLPVGASATVAVGSLGSSGGFKGSAVVKSDVQLSVLMTQIPNTNTVKVRPMATGFSSGSPDFWFLNLTKQDDRSVFTVQNIDTKASDLTLTFFSGTTPTVITKSKVPAGSSLFFDLNALPELTQTFYNAVHVVSKRSGSSDLGKIVGVNMYVSTDPSYDTTIESANQIGTTIFMPTAICLGMANLSTTYFIFNPDTANAVNVTVTYNTGKSESRSVAATSGGYFHACNPSNTSAGYYGSAVITSTGPIMVTGILKYSGTNTAFYGQAVGTSKLAIPFANYSTANFDNMLHQRTTISVMNLGSALPAGAVSVQYYDKNGVLVGTHTLDAMGTGGMITSTAANIGAAGAEFGYYSDGTTGGSAIVVGPAGSNLMATAWVMAVTGSGTYTNEMYNAIPVSVN